MKTPWVLPYSGMSVLPQNFADKIILWNVVNSWVVLLCCSDPRAPVWAASCFWMCYKTNINHTLAALCIGKFTDMTMHSNLGRTFNTVETFPKVKTDDVLRKLLLGNALQLTFSRCHCAKLIFWPPDTHTFFKTTRTFLSAKELWDHLCHRNLFRTLRYMSTGKSFQEYFRFFKHKNLLAAGEPLVHFYNNNLSHRSEALRIIFITGTFQNPGILGKSQGIYWGS